MIDIEDERELESKIGGQCVTRDEENLLNSICSFNSNFIEKEEETVMQFSNLRSQQQPQGGDQQSNRIIYSPNFNIELEEERIKNEEVKIEEESNETFYIPNFNRKIYASLKGKEKKQYLGEIVYPFVYAKEPTTAAKITGMLLDIDDEELINDYKNTDNLIRKIEEASNALKMYKQRAC